MRKLIALLFILTSSAQAGVRIGATRVIYAEGEKQASVSVENFESNPYLIQAWVNNTQATKKTQYDNTFVIAPPLFRLDGHSQNSVRVIYSGKPLPTDRESLFWLNIKMIPASQPSSINHILVASKTILKLFYRPKGLRGSAADAYKQLQFTRDSGKVVINNPTPYYLSFAKITIGNTDLSNLKTLAPFTQQAISLPSTSGNKVMVQVINDYGGISTPFTTKI